MRGIIIREDPDALILRPNDDEVLRFGAGSHVNVTASQPTTAGEPPNWNEIMVEGWLYDAHGRKVARVQEVSMRHDRIDHTSYTGMSRSYSMGTRQIDIRAVGIG